MVKALVIQEDDRLREVNYDSEEQLSVLFNGIRLLSHYKYDDETLFVYYRSSSMTHKHNTGQLPHYFNVRYLPGDIIIICKNNNTNLYEDFCISDYKDILSVYDTDSDESIDIQNTDSDEMSIENDSYDYEDGFIVRDDEVSN